MNNIALKKWLNSEYGNYSLLAKELKITRQALSKIIRSDSPISVKHIAATSKFTGIPSRDLRPDLWEIFKDDFDNLKQQNNDIKKKLTKMQREHQSLLEVEIVPTHTFYSGNYR